MMNDFQSDFFGAPQLLRKISITVPGEPVSKGRPRVRLTKSKAFKKLVPILYTPKETEEYEQKVACAARKVIGDGTPAIETQCQLRARIYEGIPKSWSNKEHMNALNGIIRPTSRPDTDNYLKALLDGLNGVLFKDDSQIVDVSASKYYSATPRVEIEVFV